MLAVSSVAAYERGGVDSDAARVSVVPVTNHLPSLRS
jgi:hypothetical protein